MKIIKAIKIAPQQFIPFNHYIENEIGYFDISKEDKANGSPKLGDMIAINKDNPSDKWLVSKEFFEENYKIIE